MTATPATHRISQDDAMSNDGLPGTQWIPSNSSEGMTFLQSNCAGCAHVKSMREGADLDDCDDSELCDIIARSFRNEAVEWRLLDNNDVVCLAYSPAGPQRCTETIDMFSAV